MTTSRYMDIILGLIKIRATNYRLTDDEFTRLFDYAYREIMMETRPHRVQFDYAITSDKPYIDIEDAYSNSEEYNKDNIIDPVSVVIVETGHDVTDKFDWSDILNPKLMNDCLYVDYCGFFDEYGTSVPVQITITTIPDIGSLDNRIQDMIKPAMIEGILFNIESYIPSQVNSQVANLSYQRYYNEKKRLKQELPQYL